MLEADSVGAPLCKCARFLFFGSVFFGFDGLLGLLVVCFLVVWFWGFGFFVVLDLVGSHPLFFLFQEKHQGLMWDSSLCKIQYPINEFWIFGPGKILNPNRTQNSIQADHVGALYDVSYICIRLGTYWGGLQWLSRRTWRFWLKFYCGGRGIFARKRLPSAMVCAKISAMHWMSIEFADGHTASNAPDLFRPPKLSGAGPG